MRGTLFAFQSLDATSLSNEPIRETAWSHLSSARVKAMKSTVQSRSDQPPPAEQAMDVRDALNRLGNDEELLRDIVQIYLEDSPAMLDRIRSAVAESDVNSLQRAAHSLKGLAATLSAHEVVGAAAHLEHIATSRNLAEAAQAVADVDRRVSDLNQAAQQFLRRK